MGITTIGSGFHSVNYVVRDAKRAAERFSSLVPGTAFAAGTVRMNPIDRGGLAVELDAAIAHLGPRGEYEVRMLHPLGRDPMFHRALAARGPGLHHVGFRVADLHCAAQRMARCAALAAELRDEAGGRHLFYTCDPIGGLI